MKLTPKQNAVIYLLQQGWVLITSAYDKFVTVAGKSHQFNISITLFWNLVEKGLIYQSMNWEKDRFAYILTKLGKEIKTKPVTL